MSEPVKLHIGGVQKKDGWKILNILPGPDVDFLGSCTDLSLFGDAMVDEVYASHVFEHLQAAELKRSLHEIRRVLKPGGVLKGSVPDLNALCELFLRFRDDAEKQFHISRMIYGGHIDEFDIHHCGFTLQLMAANLFAAGFTNVVQYNFLGEFNDTSNMVYEGVPISLNFIATR